MPRIKLEPLGLTINVSGKKALWRSLKQVKVELATMRQLWTVPGMRMRTAEILQKLMAQ